MERPVTQDAGAAEPRPDETTDEVAATAEVGPQAADVPERDETTAAADGPATDTGSPFAPDEVPVEEDPRSREELIAELGEAESRRDEYLDDLRRARAEFENYRKRTMREGAAQRHAGKADVAGGLLEVLDDLDRTIEAVDDDADDPVAKGVVLVADKLVRVLQSQGLERLDTVGVAFDPTVHEAVQQRPADEPRDEPTVVEVLRPGYRLGDRVLRAAMVVVEG
jgi:molecular chaperone GrpE